MVRVCCVILEKLRVLTLISASEQQNNNRHMTRPAAQTTRRNFVSSFRSCFLAQTVLVPCRGLSALEPRRAADTCTQPEAYKRTSSSQEPRHATMAKLFSYLWP